MGDVYFPKASHFYDDGAKSGGCAGGAAPNSPRAFDPDGWYWEAGEEGSFVRVDKNSFIYTGSMGELVRAERTAGIFDGGDEAGEVDSDLQAALEPLVREKMLQWWYDNPGNSVASYICRSTGGSADGDETVVSFDIDEMYLGLMRIEYPDGTASAVFTLGVVIDDVEDAFIKCGENTFVFPPA